jgi:hypothetical protein
MPERYVVDVFFDPEASVWVALGANLVGLATEASTLPNLKRRVRAIAPDLLELNHGIVSPLANDILEFRMLTQPPAD